MKSHKNLYYLLSVATMAVIVLPPLANGQESWTKLFNGNNLEGWKPTGRGSASYCVASGAIIGKTKEGSGNTYLRTEKEYGDFELKFDVKLDEQLNSGVQIRSKNRGEKPTSPVFGPQVEIDAGDEAGSRSGYLFGEGLGTGWLSRTPKKHDYFKNGQWNKYHVKAIGDRIQTWVNNKMVADLTDDKTDMRMGFIALQVHGIPSDTGPFEVRWKNIYVRDLSK